MANYLVLQKLFWQRIDRFKGCCGYVQFLLTVSLTLSDGKEHNICESLQEGSGAQLTELPLWA